MLKLLVGLTMLATIGVLGCESAQPIAQVPQQPHKKAQQANRRARSEGGEATGQQTSRTRFFFDVGSDGRVTVFGEPFDAPTLGQLKAFLGQPSRMIPRKESAPAWAPKLNQHFWDERGLIAAVDAESDSEDDAKVKWIDVSITRTQFTRTQNLCRYPVRVGGREVTSHSRLARVCREIGAEPQPLAACKFGPALLYGSNQPYNNSGQVIGIEIVFE